MCIFVSDLLALRTEEEWEEVRQRISDLPQDEALTAEFSKVLPTVSLFVLTAQVLLPAWKGRGEEGGVQLVAICNLTARCH